MMIYVIYPGLIFWIMILPGLILYRLSKKKHKLKKISVQFKYGFLYSDYRSRLYFWEFIRGIMRILIAFCANYFASYHRLQGMLMMLVLLSYGILFSRTQPFLTSSHNKLEIMSIFISLFTVFTATLYLDIDDEDF